MLWGGLSVSEKELHRATWGVGLTGPPCCEEMGYRPTAWPGASLPNLGGLGGRADGGRAGAGVPGLLSGRGGCSAGHQTGPTPGKTSKDGGLARAGRCIFGHPMGDAHLQRLLTGGALGHTGLKFSLPSQAGVLGELTQQSRQVGERAHSPEALIYKLASEPTSAAPPGYSCQRPLSRERSMLPISLLPVTPGEGGCGLGDFLSRQGPLA